MKSKTHITETPHVNHEVSDVHVGGIAKFVLALFVLTVGVFFLVWGMFRVFEARTQETPRSPLALSEHDRLPPEPRLQGAPGFGEQLSKTARPEKNEEGQTVGTAQTGGPKDPLWEIRELRRQWKDVLENGPIDQNGHRYGMPIEKAEEEILKQGVAVRK